MNIKRSATVVVVLFSLFFHSAQAQAMLARTMNSVIRPTRFMARSFTSISNTSGPIQTDLKRMILRGESPTLILLPQEANHWIELADGSKALPVFYSREEFNAYVILAGLSKEYHKTWIPVCAPRALSTFLQYDIKVAFLNGMVSPSQTELEFSWYMPSKRVLRHWYSKINGNPVHPLDLFDPSSGDTEITSIEVGSQSADTPTEP